MKVSSVFRTVAVLLILAQVVGSAQKADTTTQGLAADIFSELRVRVVRCPPYTYSSGNRPICGVSEMTPEAYTEAFDKAAGKLEPQGDWDEDHTVWLRRYTAEGATYAAVYSEIAQGFNVQLIRLR